MSTTDRTLQPRPLYLVAEKILSAGEGFRTRWPIHGSTGYLFLNLANGLLVDRSGLKQLQRLWTRFSGQDEPFDEIAYASRRLIAHSAMASEMNMLGHALERLASRDRRSRDFTLNSLRRVLREVVASFPVYRTYVTARGVSPIDRDIIARAIAEARRRSPVMEESIFVFIERVLTGGGSVEAMDEESLRFAMRFQQITGPIQAKGLEDTAFYRYGPLIAVNEVGSSPAAPVVTAQEFHDASITRLSFWPATMSTIDTHDTKRSSDARARLAALTDRVGDWRRAVRTWMRLNRQSRSSLAGAPAPDRADEYHFYQALLAVWPPEPEDAPVPSTAPDGLDRRLAEYMVKAIREAKIRSSWLRPDEAYEDAVSRFVRTVLTGPGAPRFLRSFVPLARDLAWLGAANSLAQLVLLMGAPGVPDIYQGAELWHLALVDPDNRQPVDFNRRRDALGGMSSALDAAADISQVTEEQVLLLQRELASRWTDGRLKLWILASALRHRRRDPALFLQGTYLPLVASPADAPLLAFARTHGSRALVVIVPHHAGRLSKGRGWATGDAWGETRLSLPDALAGRTWRDLFTGRDLGGATSGEGRRHLPLSQVLGPLPVAWLVAH